LRLKAKVVGVILLVAWIALSPLSAGTPGTFRGKIIQAPPGKEHQGWLYVQGRNKLLRRVAVENAAVVYSDGVPSSQREKVPAHALVEGAEVRVTAEQDESGEWRALRIEILKPPARSASRATAI
jgi:hypothetical protein